MGNWGEERDWVGLGGKQIRKHNRSSVFGKSIGWERVVLEGIKENEARRLFRLLGSRPALKLWVSSFLLSQSGSSFFHSSSKNLLSTYIVCEALKNLKEGERHKRKDILSCP